MKYKVQIANPCEEKWEGMTPVDGGKFCMHCSKNVVDFTQLSDEAILKIMKNSNGNMCGRFREDQLNRDLVIKRGIYSFHSIFSKVAASLLFFIGLETASAQVRKYETAPTQTPKTIAQTPVAKKKKVIGTTKKIIQGRIYSSAGYTISKAIIFVKGTAIRVESDSTGYFKIFLPDHLIKNTLTLAVSAKGFADNEFNINQKQFGTRLKLTLSETITLDPVVVEAQGVYRTKTMRMGYCTGTTTDDKKAPANDNKQSSKKRKWWPFRKKDNKA
jgi:hypothetical protein